MSTIQLKNSDVPGKVPLPADLVAGELALNSADGKAFMKLEDGSVKELGGSGPTPPPITPWVRNPTWLPMPATTAAMEQVDCLVAVYPESSYFAMQGATLPTTGYTVDWGDGTTPQTFASNTQAFYLYDYNNPSLAGTNGPVTFNSATQTVDRVAHGYTDGVKISFAEIVTTTGITQLQTYYVVNATADTFQLSATSGGSVLPFTNDGTGAILPYKQAMVKMTPTVGGATLTTVNIAVKNNTINLNSYTNPVLDATISANCNILTVASGTIPSRLMERCTILRHNDPTLSTLFTACSSLQSVPIFNTSNVTDMSSMFSGCTSLQEAPLLNTQNVTDMTSMFNSCVNLKLVPLLNTQNVANMSNMFAGCNSLDQVPLFNTIKVTSMSTMFSSCNALLSIPLFDTSTVTNMVGMFNGCSSLREVPLLNTQNVTLMGSVSNTQGMFGNCVSLKSVPLFNTIKVTHMGNMFLSCNSLETVPLFDTSQVTNTQAMFSGCSSLMNVPLLNTQNVITMNGGTTSGGMFTSCSSLQTVPLLNTNKVLSFAYMFNGCTNIGSIPAFDTTAVTGTNAFTNMFAQCGSLQQIPDMNFNRAAITTSASYNNMFQSCASLSKINLSPGNGPKFTFSVASCKLSAASLNQLYTSLPVVTGQTITVTGNVGIAGDDPSIATAKGWAVTGS